MTNPSQNGEPIVALRGLSLAFAGKSKGETIPVLDNINLDVHAGEFVCVVGPSGCGKSTILNILGGFLKASHGEALVHGEPVVRPDLRRIFVFQESAVFPWLTVRGNVGFGLSRLAAADRAPIIKEYVAMVGLTGFEESYPHQLSGGMRQRVELARALAANPEVLYMDEPFGALDYLTRLKMRNDLVRIWQAKQLTILFVTHDIDEAVQLADRVVVLTPRPAAIRALVPINLPRPRDLNTLEYVTTRKHIFDVMGGATLLS